MTTIENELRDLEGLGGSDLRARYAPGRWGIRDWNEARAVFRAFCDARAHLLAGRGAGAGLWRDRARAEALARRWIRLADRADSWAR